MHVIIHHSDFLIGPDAHKTEGGYTPDAMRKDCGRMPPFYLRRVELPPAEEEPRLRDPGWLIVYPEGGSARRSQRLVCREGASFQWDPECTWHVDWYPRSAEADGPQTRTVTTRQGSARVHGPWTLVALQLLEDDGNGTLYLQWSTSPTDEVPTCTDEQRAAARAASQRAYEELCPVYQVLRTHCDRNVSLTREATPAMADLGWFGQCGRWRGLAIPCAAFVDAAVSQPVAQPAVLRHWVHLATERLGLPSSPPPRVRMDDAAELLAEVALTRALSMVYQIDRGARSMHTDDWWFPSESPEPATAAYDCEDMALEALGVLDDVRRWRDNGALLDWSKAVIAAAQQYVFCLGICVMKPGGTGSPTWHAVVVGLPRASFLSHLEHNGSTDAASAWPVLWLEGTEYTTSNWLRRGHGPVSMEQFLDSRAPANRGEWRRYSHVKAPAEVVERSRQYVRLHTLVVPGWLTRYTGGSRDLHLFHGDEYGVDVTEFMHRPWCPEWRWIHGPVWDGELIRAVQQIQRLWAPRPVLTRQSVLPPRNDTPVRQGWPYLLRRADAPSHDTLELRVLHDDPWGDDTEGVSVWLGREDALRSD